MNVANILKEYLVSIGFDVEDRSYRKLHNAISNIDKTIEKFAANTSKETKKAEKATEEATGSMGNKVDDLGKKYVKSATLITTALASIGAATLGLLNRVSEMDLGYQKFALHMFLGRDAAREMKIAMDALGESIEDIAWMPEIRQRYFSLVNQARGMEGPNDMEKQLRYLRDIRFEFTRLQIEGTYGMRWIAYHLTQYLSGPLADIRTGMQKFNDWLTENMPAWTDKAAHFISVLFGVARSAWRFVSDIFTKLYTAWDMLPDWAKKIAAALTVALAPVSPALKVLGALILAIDDFYAYIDGRKSSKILGPIWHALITTVDYIVKGLVAAMVAADYLFSANDRAKAGKKSSWSDMMNEIHQAWNFAGVADPNGNKYEWWDAPWGSKSGTPTPTPTPGSTSKLPDLGSLFDNLKYGAKNYQNTMDNPSYMTPTASAAPSGDQKIEINVGGVSVQITQPGATAKEVYDSTVSAVTDSMGMAVARKTRELSGVYQ